MIQFVLPFIFLSSLFALESDKDVKQLSQDPLFHTKRETGLTLHDAINRAIDNSPKMQAATQLVIQDKMKVSEAFADHLPVVSFSGDGGFESRNVKKDATTNPSAVTTSQKYKKVDVYLTITENLWNGGAIEDAVDEKDAGLKASLYDYRDKLESLVVDTANAYFNVVYGEIALNIALKNMKNYEKILNIVTIKEKNGAATKGDVNFIKANVDNAKTELVQREKTLSDAIAKYTYLLQTHDQELFPFEISSALSYTDLNTSLANADKYNAQVLRQRAYITSTSYGFLATKGSFHPKVDFAINGESRNEYDVGLGKREKVNAVLMFNYNLYRGGKDEARAIRLLAKMKEQKFLYQDLKRNLVFDIKVLNQSVSSLDKSLKLTEQEVLAARKVVNSYWIAFQHGTQDLQALQLAQRNLNSAEQNYAQYKKDLILNNYELMRKTGTLLQFLDLLYKKDASQFKEDEQIFNAYYDLEI
jgi:adhesin transport system outer membrane protein